MKYPKLGDITKNLDNRRIPVNSLERKGLSKKGLYPYIGANNIMGYIDEYIFDEKILCVAEDGGSWGAEQICANIYHEKCWVNNHAHVLVENGQANLEYLRYFLNKTNLNKYITGTTRGKLTKSALDSIIVPLPSLSTQLHIANLLSKAENLIARRKESIRLLDEYVKSVFLEMFGDPVKNEKGWEKLNGAEYCQKLTVGVVIKPASHYVEKGVIALRSINIKPNRIDLNNLVYFSRDINDNELAKSILREGDVVFVRTGLTGTAAIIPKELDGCNCIDLIITRPKKGVIHPKYLVFFFNSDLGKRIVTSKEVGGIQKHFNIGAIKALKIPIPPIKLQIHFAQIVEKTEALKAWYQLSLQELENLYGSLSQRAFRGEIWVPGEI